MPEPQCYYFAGGGTGGHLTPGLAVAERLKALPGPGCEAVFVGSSRTIERDMVAAAGYRHIPLPVRSTHSFRRRPLTFMFCNWRAYRAAHDLLAGEPARAVIGLGGFASLPLVWAAARRGVPTILLEQNVIPGRANRFLSRRVAAVCVAFPELQSWFRKAAQVVVTGNPVRGPIAALAAENLHPPDATGRTILVLGGSQGAAGVNEAVRQMIADNPAHWQGTSFVHQTGQQQADEMRAAYARAGVTAVVEPFIRDLVPYYRQASLAISRAGAATLAELACAGCPAVLVPYPHAADDHQTHNAELFARHGAAQVVQQGRGPAETAAALTKSLTEILENKARLANLRQQMHGLARPDAAERVVDVLQTLVDRAMT